MLLLLEMVFQKSEGFLKTLSLASTRDDKKENFDFKPPAAL